MKKLLTTTLLLGISSQAFGSSSASEIAKLLRQLAPLIKESPRFQKATGLSHEASLYAAGRMCNKEYKRF